MNATDYIELLGLLRAAAASVTWAWHRGRTMTTERRHRTLRAKLIGAYRRRDDLAARGLPLDDVTARSADLEEQAPAGIIDEARRLAEPATGPAA